MQHHHLKKEAKNAIILAVMCFIAYLAVYFLRNILSAVSPQMEAAGDFTDKQTGLLGSVFFASYAIGQLFNGIIGDRIKAKYMMSLGLTLAGISHILFVLFADSAVMTTISYALVGLFLSMIYAPMTKVVSENVNLNYAQRCSVAYSFSSFLGSPTAGVCAAVMSWTALFYFGGALIVAVGIGVFIFFIFAEKKGIVSYGKFTPPEKKGGSLKVLLKRQIVKYTFVSVLTGIVRTSVVFFLPTYLYKYLGFSESTSTLIFTVATLIISLSAFLTVAIFEMFKRDMNKTLLTSFVLSALAFVGTFLFKQPVVNMLCIVLAIMMSNCAASMLWSYYCPSLRDTGMVSTATGYLDFMSYIAAAVANLLSPYAVSSIGWGGLILVWTALMVFGVLIAIPFKKKTKE